MFSVYGPGQNLSNLRQGMASIFLAYLLRGETVPVLGSLDRVRDFVFIDDVVDLWAGALDRPVTPSTVYNVGTGQGTTVEALIRALIGALGLPLDHPIEVRDGSPSDQLAMIAETMHLTRELGWRSTVDLAQGLERMVAWAAS